MVYAHRIPPVLGWELVTALARNQIWQGRLGLLKSFAANSFTTQVHDARVHLNDVDDVCEAQHPDVQKASEGREAEQQDGRKGGGQMAWLTDMLEPAIKLYRRALPAGGRVLTKDIFVNSEKDAGAANTASLVDIAASILRSTSGMQMTRWSIADLTLGLYFLSVRHASQMAGDTFAGDLVTSDLMVGDLIYYVELARGSYQKDAAGLARISMIQESNVVKFEDKSSVMRPGYYIAIDKRHKLVILCIRGTHTVHDIITDLASHSENSATLEGESVHYGSVEAARWFMQNELATLKGCLKQHAGYELRLVGHSLGGATAALLAFMLREKIASQELEIHPELIRAVTIASPPCVSKKLARKCSHFITTLVLQDDVIPRMNTAALGRLRDEILLTDWTLLKESQDHKGLVELVESTLSKFSSVQDVARRYASYVNLTSPGKDEEEAKQLKEEVVKKIVEKKDGFSKGLKDSGEDESSAREKRTELVKQQGKPGDEHPELCVPGLLLLVCGGRPISGADDIGREGHVLLKGYEGTQFGRIVLSSTMLSDHKCISIYYALRDVLKGLPKTGGSDKLSL